MEKGRRGEGEKKEKGRRGEQESDAVITNHDRLFFWS